MQTSAKRIGHGRSYSYGKIVRQTDGRADGQTGR